jgi:hypothetical protein
MSFELHVALRFTNGKSEHRDFEAQVPDWHNCFLPSAIEVRLPRMLLYLGAPSLRQQQIPTSPRIRLLTPQIYIVYTATVRHYRNLNLTTALSTRYRSPSLLAPP